MARRRPLSDLKTMLRAEMRESTNLLHQPDWNPIAVRALSSAQRLLWMAERWKFLEFDIAVPLSAGERYHAIPATPAGIPEVDIEGILKVVIQRSYTTYDLDYGIEYHHYAERDSVAIGARPVEKWDFPERWDLRDDGTAVKLELWPVLNENASDIACRLYFHRGLSDLALDTDLCDLDDELIVLFAAADLMSGRDAKDAQVKAAKAQAYLEALKIRTSKVGQGHASFLRQSGRRPGVNIQYAPRR